MTGPWKSLPGLRIWGFPSHGGVKTGRQQETLESFQQLVEVGEISGTQAVGSQSYQPAPQTSRQETTSRQESLV